MSDINKQQLTNTLVTMLPAGSNISVNDNTILATSNDLYFLHSELGDYALKFAKVSTDFEYTSYALKGTIDVGNGLSGSAAVSFGEYDGLNFSVEGDAQVYGLKVQSTSSTDGSLSAGSGFDAIILEGGIVEDTNGNSVSNLSFNLPLVAFGGSITKNGDRIIGFATEAGPSFGKFANAKFVHDTKNVDVGFHLEKQIPIQPEIGGLFSDIDDIYRELKQSFPSIHMSENQFYAKVAANMQFSDKMSDNWDELEAAGIVV